MKSEIWGWMEMVFSSKSIHFRILTHLGHSARSFEGVLRLKERKGSPLYMLLSFHWDRIAETSLEVLRRSMDMFSIFSVKATCTGTSTAQNLPPVAWKLQWHQWHPKAEFGMWTMMWRSDVVPLRGIMQAKNGSFERALKFVGADLDTSSGLGFLL